ncbi:MAG: ABC transporter ATP-binding protein [Phreatobacter sp.]|uniref:ABC transporter ATP-binding protein n=1 Tax=Phreatobacter sp. TaxID=1966341 RepID=UPI001A55BD01|nr:ABC transporter ATP-binding protein [Phreatobacter sp.]MBL8569292.1 ABC transporter ATP-binding protein [Phreatobacter sp.]
MSRIDATGLLLQRGSKMVLDGVDFDAGPTGAIAVVGPNGAGKSSLAKILAGLITDHAGTARIAGRPVASLTGPERTALIGYVPQSFHPHWDITPRMLVEMGAERSTTADAAAITAVLAAREIGPIADRRWSALSGGEQARALLASVEVTDPPILIADEPGASLDIRHRIDLVRGFAARGRERLVIVVLHDIELATTWFERVVVMDQGRVAADLPSAELAGSDVLPRVFRVPFETVTVDGVAIARPASGRHA